MTARESDSALFRSVRQIVIDTLGLAVPAHSLHPDTPLYGAIPELDSMGVVLLLTALEDRFDLTFSDDEIDTQWFTTLGSLTKAVEDRLPSS